jgi:hypothetical protein
MLRGNGDPEYRRRIREKAEKDQQIAETERREANNKYNIEKIAAAIERVGQKLDRTNDEQTPQKKSDRRWERFGFLGLWFAGFVGIAAILVGTHDSSEQRGVMQGQLNTMQSAVGQSGETIGTMKAQADIMRGQLNEMEIARRPWITADFGIAGPLEMKDGALTTTLGIILRNTGQTPAVRTDIAIDLFPVQAFDIYIVCIPHVCR